MSTQVQLISIRQHDRYSNVSLLRVLVQCQHTNFTQNFPSWDSNPYWQTPDEVKPSLGCKMLVSIHSICLSARSAPGDAAWRISVRLQCCPSELSRTVPDPGIETKRSLKGSFSGGGQWAFSCIWLTLSSSDTHKGRDCLDTMRYGAWL